MDRHYQSHKNSNRPAHPNKTAREQTTNVRIASCEVRGRRCGAKEALPLIHDDSAVAEMMYNRTQGTVVSSVEVDLSVLPTVVDVDPVMLSC